MVLYYCVVVYAHAFPLPRPCLYPDLFIITHFAIVVNCCCCYIYVVNLLPLRYCYAFDYFTLHYILLIDYLIPILPTFSVNCYTFTSSIPNYFWSCYIAFTLLLIIIFNYFTIYIIIAFYCCYDLIIIITLLLLYYVYLLWYW